MDNLRWSARGMVMLVALLAVPGAVHGQTLCQSQTGCAWSTCAISCSAGNVEAQLRAGVALANSCNADANPEPNPLPAQKTIVFTTGCTAGINLQLPLTGTTTGCPAKNYADNAICLTGHNIVIDGAVSGGKVAFEYTGTDRCDPADPDNLDEGGVALFVVSGSGNVLRNFELDYFPDGIHVYRGKANQIRNVSSDHICDDVVTVETGDLSSGTPGHPRDTLIIDGSFTGGTCGCPRTSSCPCASEDACGSTCLNRTAANGVVCGIDKAVQINGGVNTRIKRTTFTQVGQAVNLNTSSSSVTVDLECSQVYGRPPTQPCNPEDSCAGLTVQGGMLELSQSKLRHCRFGTRISGFAQVDAHDNVVRDAYVSAFSLRCPGQTSGNAGSSCASTQPRLKGERNWMINYGFSTTVSDCPKGAVVVRNTDDGTSPTDPQPVDAIVDFGGGLCGSGLGTCDTLAGTPVVGAAASVGRNVFCDAGRNLWWNGYEHPTCTGGTVINACDDARRIAMCHNTFNLDASFVGPGLYGGGCDTTGQTGACNTEPNVLGAAVCSGD